MDTGPSRKMIKLKKLPETAIKWIGSTSSLVIHTVLFLVAFLLPLFKSVSFGEMLLVLTTIVSLEAIYLSIFIQMSVNRSTQYIEIIHEDVNEIHEDVSEITEDVSEISENIDEMQKEEDDEDDELLNNIQETLLILQKEVNTLKKNIKSKK